MWHSAGRPLTYLLFLRRLDELQTLQENSARRSRQPVADPVFGPGEREIRWSRLRDQAPDVMFDQVDRGVFPWLRRLVWRRLALFASHAGRRVHDSDPHLLSRVVDMLDDIPLDTRDTNGDLYEYLLSLQSRRRSRAGPEETHLSGSASVVISVVMWW
ncbi:type I restriction-modification system subunit M N-terminal domain-containing protein [Propionicicella superfundia]|uniref:type I restriction-modification system subunit M N-terminal domain-containing protein n=1 Tax=Propionicicella superfundia TaxID=348582 RepID=UPI0003F72A32|nr:type I restriction-modification system subunit M N-terminal domain-containing protein [Propionicicella superfundia]